MSMKVLTRIEIQGCVFVRRRWPPPNCKRSASWLALPAGMRHSIFVSVPCRAGSLSATGGRDELACAIAAVALPPPGNESLPLFGNVQFSLNYVSPSLAGMKRAGATPMII